MSYKLCSEFGRGNLSFAATSMTEVKPPSIPAKVAVITGASAGIGRATAIALSADGWKLVLAGRRVGELENTAKLCAGYVPYVCSGDVSDEEFVVKLFESAKREYGHIDMVFNNAGISGPALPMEELPLSKWMDVINTNVTGTFLCTREAFKYFKTQSPQGGRIINNGSLAAHTPRPFSTPYTASKHAVAGLTKSTALDGRQFNITCTQIDIGIFANAPITSRSPDSATNANALGNALTEMALKNTQGILQANGSILSEPSIDVKRVAEAVLHVASLPNDVTVLEMNIMATGMPYVGRG